MIARAPALRQEAEACLPALERALSQPAEPEDLLMALNEQAPAYGVNVQEGRPEEWAARWKVYVKALEGFSREVVEAAFLAWSKGEVVSDAVAKSFYPRPPQLHDACVLARNQLAQMRYRIKAALERQEKAPPKPVDPEERKRVAAEFAALAKTLGGPKAPDAGPQRPMHGSPAQVADRLRSAGVPINRPAGPNPDEVIL